MRILKFGAAAVAAAFVAQGAAAQDWKDSPEVQALYEAAKAEGRVMIWGTHAKEVDWVPAAFAEAFPGIEVEYLGDNDIATKAITEARGGRHAVDVFQTSFTASIPVYDRGLFAENDWSIFGIGDEGHALGGQFGLSHTIAYAFVYNTDLVDPADVPENWLDITDEKYRGKMAASLFLLPRLIGGIGLEIGEEAAIEFARELVNDADMLLTRAPRENFLQTGERPIAAGEVDSLVRTWMAAGLPVDYITPEPVVTGQFGVAVMANAQNPNAARLLAGYLATPEGKARRAQSTMQYDYLPGTQDAMPASLHERGATIVYDTQDKMAAREAIINQVSPILQGQAQ
jgi:iron(III) transport system substrate-binding protein